jgi:hypothetical protein
MRGPFRPLIACLLAVLLAMLVTALPLPKPRGQSWVRGSRSRRR